MPADKAPERPPSPTGRVTVVISDGDAGRRLDRVLADRLAPAVSRTRLKTLILDGKVHVGGATLRDPGYRVKPGDGIAVDVPPPEPAEPGAEEIPLSVLYEDGDIIVVDKPAGLVVHPAPGHQGGTLVNALVAHCGESLSGIGGVRRPGIVHRLDKETSGVMVVAKTDAAHHGLAEQFAAHGADGRMSRTYLALVWGAPARPRGTIEAALARSERNRTKIAVSAKGRRAVTHYEVAETFDCGTGKPLAALVRLVLETGRTHQIRVHLAHAGHPVMGDPVYGTGFKASAGKLPQQAREALAALGRQALHATELGFEHPTNGRKLSFVSPLPDDIAALVAALRRPARPSPKRGTR